MARLKANQIEEIIAKWKAGRTQNYLSKEYNVSPATINKYCKGVDQENIEIVNNKVSVYTALDGKSEYEVNAIHSIADERTKHELLFTNSGARNQVLTNKVLTKIEDKEEVGETDLYALDMHSKITQRNKETVLGKDKTTEISQTQQTEVKSISVTYE